MNSGDQASTSNCKVLSKLKKLKLTPKEESIPQDAVLPIHMDYLTPLMMDNLSYSVNETEENKEAGLNALSELVKNEKNMNPRLDENFLLQFLRARKYDVKAAFKLYQNYYRFRKEFDYVIGRALNHGELVPRVLLKNYFGLLLHRDKFGAAILVAKIGQWDPTVDTYEDMFATILSCISHAIEFPATQVCGFRVIVDLRHLAWKHVRYCTPFNVRLIVRSTEYCFPGRYTAIHILTENKFFNLIWNISYPFFTNKVKKRVHLHGRDLSDMLNYIDASVLPTEFGGEYGPFDNAPWKLLMLEEVLAQKEFYQYGYDKC